jgi:hypothetical protein
VRLTIILIALAAVTACTQPTREPPPAPVQEARPQPRAQPDSFTLLARHAEPERDAIREAFRYDRRLAMTEIDGLRYYFYDEGGRRDMVGFAFINAGSPTVNPVGLKKSGPRREYAFFFADRARENIHLAINDDVRVSGRYSHDNMFREWHFFPRRQLPALAVDDETLDVTLPTGERVRFDRRTKEIRDGVLDESPIDFNPSRHQRVNPRVAYRGDYLAITVAQRGEAPRRASVWGRRKFAEAHYPSRYAKPCRLSPARLWDQRPKPGDSDPRLVSLHRTDEGVLREVERACGWNLDALRSPSRPTPMMVQSVSRSE